MAELINIHVTCPLFLPFWLAYVFMERYTHCKPNTWHIKIQQTLLLWLSPKVWKLNIPEAFCMGTEWMSKYNRSKNILTSCLALPALICPRSCADSKDSQILRHTLLRNLRAAYTLCHQNLQSSAQRRLQVYTTEKRYKPAIPVRKRSNIFTISTPKP